MKNSLEEFLIFIYLIINFTNIIIFIFIFLCKVEISSNHHYEEIIWELKAN